MKQLSLLEPRTHGGRREGAGRRPARVHAGVQHRIRARHSRHHPVHVTMRAREGLPSLRTDKALSELIRSALGASHKPWFRVVHFSIQSNHLHLIVEADSTEALSRGMQALGIRIVHAVHRALGHGGRVFADRYHAHELRTPRETRSALLYVLQNWLKHGRGHGLDPHSSARWFDGWREAPEANEPPLIAPAKTWLIRFGWRRRGLLDPGERPV